jgi:hypothetical protein
MTYNEFQTACKKAWETEGHGNSDIQAAHQALLAVEKTTRMTKVEIIAAAWSIYKQKR